MLQDLVDSPEQEQFSSMEDPLTSSPIVSHLLNFSAAAETADLFSDAIFKTSGTVVSSSPTSAAATTELFYDPLLQTSGAILSANPDTITATAATTTIDPCDDRNALVSAALAMDPSTLSSFLDSQSPDTANTFDQLAAYSANTMLPECLMPAGTASYLEMEPVTATAATSCSTYVYQGIGGLMYQVGASVDSCGGDGGGFLPAMVGYRNAVVMGVQYGMDPLQHVYSSHAPEMQMFGDRQLQQLARTCSSPMPVTDVHSPDDWTSKVGRISAEERKEKIHRYIKKRNKRNFSKKIKYACRKTLADSRPRVRGRFAKNEEAGEAARVGSSHKEYDEDDEVLVKEEDPFDPSDILAHVAGVNSFKYYYSLATWL